MVPLYQIFYSVERFTDGLWEQLTLDVFYLGSAMEVAKKDAHGFPTGTGAPLNMHQRSKFESAIQNNPGWGPTMFVVNVRTKSTCFAHVETR